MKPSRAMIPGEILCSLHGALLAWFGGVQPGWLHTVLEARGDAVAWLFMLGVPSWVQLFLAVREWIFWRRWGVIAVERSARWRARAIMGQGLCWLYAIYFGFHAGAFLIGWLGLIAFGFCCWSYLENRRSCREIRYATAAIA